MTTQFDPNDPTRFEEMYRDERVAHGLPAATLTDNGSVYTARFTHGHNEFELLLHTLGVTQKNGHPGHPQTQGKIERFHQTLKKRLRALPAAATLTELQHQIDAFLAYYNHVRPFLGLAELLCDVA